MGCSVGGLFHIADPIMDRMDDTATDDRVYILPRGVESRILIHVCKSPHLSFYSSFYLIAFSVETAMPQNPAIPRAISFRLHIPEGAGHQQRYRYLSHQPRFPSSPHAVCLTRQLNWIGDPPKERAPIPGGIHRFAALPGLACP